MFFFMLTVVVVIEKYFFKQWNLLMPDMKDVRVSMDERHPSCRSLKNKIAALVNIAMCK